ncbi:hypothetical protein P5V15_007222 [Pogonomyrmex californicus]
MKNQNKKSKKCYANQPSISMLNKASSTQRKILRLNSKWQIIYNKKYKKYSLIRKSVGFDEYIFYSILNTDIVMELGIVASVIARCILNLHNKLAANRTKKPYINEWQKSGENIIVLRGYNHKHLKYLEGEARFAALGKHAIYRQWYNSRVMLVLSVFGRREEIEYIFDGLSHLR